MYSIEQSVNYIKQIINLISTLELLRLKESTLTPICVFCI